MRRNFIIGCLLAILPGSYILAQGQKGLETNLKVLAQEQKGFEIVGHIEGLKEGEKVLLKLFHDNGFHEFTDWTRADSAYVYNGEFRLRGFAPDGPRMYWMEFNRHPNNVIRLLLDTGQISIYSSNIEKIPHMFLDGVVKITGSASNNAVHALVPATQMYLQSYFRINNVLKQIKDSIGFDSTLISGVMMAKQAVMAALYNAYLAHFEDDYKPAALHIIDGGMFERTDHASFWMDVYNNLDEHEKNSFYGKRLKEKLPLCVGQPFPSFNLPNADGRSLSLSNGLGKLTIVHFWAENSYNRQEMQQELLGIYKQYHSKGLNVLAISSDNNIKRWKDVLKADQFPWLNVIDVKGKMVDSVYHELGPPETHNTTNVVLDAEGKIIAWDVLGVELQWYVWKYLQSK